MATKKEELQEVQKELLIYAGVSVPELMLRKGGIYEQIPELPQEFSFLKDFFVSLSEYPKFKMQNREKIEELPQKIREALKKEVK